MRKLSNPVKIIKTVLFLAIISGYIPWFDLLCFANEIPSYLKTEDDLDIRQWIGKKFILLPKPDSLQHFGYMLFLHPDTISYKGPSSPLETPIIRNITYEPFSMKILTVSKIYKGKFGDDNYMIEFICNKPKVKLYAESNVGHVMDVAYCGDLDKAIARWKGKTIYSKYKGIMTNDSEIKKIVGTLQFGTPLKVTEVTYSTNAFKPIRITVSTSDGSKGYFDTSFSLTNVWSFIVDKLKNGKSRPWDLWFHESDPLMPYYNEWNKEIIESIRNFEPRIGMSKEQVVLFLEHPKNINKTITEFGIEEEWIYNKYFVVSRDPLKSEERPWRYLYFKDDKLFKIIERDN